MFEKEDDIVNLLRRWKNEPLTSTKVKMKGFGDTSECERSGICGGVQESKTGTKGLVFMLNKIWYSAVIEFLCITCGILWFRLKFSRVRLCSIVGHKSFEIL